MNFRDRLSGLPFFPRSLVGQLVLVLILALLLTQVIGALVFSSERRAALRTLSQDDTLSRTASIGRVLAETPPGLHERILDAATSQRLRFWVDDTRAVADDSPRTANNRVSQRLKMLMNSPDDRAVFVDVREVEIEWFRPKYERFDDDDDDDEEEHDHRRWHRRHGPTSLLISIELNDGRWLNAENLFRTQTDRLRWATGLTLTTLLVFISSISILLVRRITLPMRRLADAAAKLGRGEDAGPLPETGPIEARNTTRSFNDMRDRLQRFIDDRMHMLAATSHDLRTPLTSLRLRAELVEDPDLRSKMLVTLDEMQHMVEAMLAFVREDAKSEETRDVDITALIDSIAGDLGDLGHRVHFSDAHRIVFRCRPYSLTRALRNLIENAVRHGGGADIQLADTDEALTITIDDEGPGIPDAELNRAFDPFVRLDKARSQETGGMGLGLAIARGIIRAHGGEITLTNRALRGLRVTVTLPRA